MVTRQQIREQLGKRPFQPFRVTLNDGETLDIVRIAQAVVTPRELIVGIPEDRTRWVEIRMIERLDAFELNTTA